MSNQGGGEVATKVDLEQTKQELFEKLASKEELKQAVAKLATKEELKEVNKSLDSLTKQVEENTVGIKVLQNLYFRLEERMDKLETKEESDRKFDILIKAIDGLIGKIDHFQIELASTDHSIMRHEKQLKKHEERITILEEVSIH